MFATLFYISYNLGSLVNFIPFFSRSAYPVILFLALKVILGELEKGTEHCRRHVGFSKTSTFPYAYKIGG